MADSQYGIWMLQLMRYFIGHCGFMQINVPGGHKDEVWLTNPQDANYIVIHMGIADGYADAENRARMVTVVTTLLNIAKRKGRMLDICLDERSVAASDELIDHIAIFPGCMVPERIKKQYPGVETVVFDADDPIKEEQLLGKSIQQSQQEQYRKHIRPIELLRQNTSLMFWIIMGICVIIWAGLNITTKVAGVDSISAAIFWGAYYKAFIVIFNDWWRLLTAGFVHISVFHLLCNMIALFNLSQMMKQFYKDYESIIILVVSIIVGNLFVFIGDVNTVSVGLSGGLYGWMAATIVYFWKNGYFKDAMLRRQIYSTIIINLLISLMPNVSLLAHLGGAAAGLFLAFVFCEKDNRTMARNIAIAGAVTVIALGVLAYTDRGFNDFYYGTDLQVAEICHKAGLEDASTKITLQTLDYYNQH